MKFGQYAATVFSMGLLAAALSGCQKQEAPAQNSGNAPAEGKPSTQARSPAQTKCTQCGVIESIREIETKGEGSGLGVVGGAVVGGLIGNQVGKGRGNDAATVVGVVGGAVAGNQIEKSVRSTKSYDITVRFEEGSSRVFREENPPAWRIGDRVKVINGAIRSND